MSIHDSEISGFFIKKHEQLTKSIDIVTLNNFANLQSDDDRVRFVCDLPAVRDFDLTAAVGGNKDGGPDATYPARKDDIRAKELKRLGNVAVQNGDWDKALHFYNESYIHMPHDDEVAIVLANRSAALYHKGQMELSLADIARCLAAGYPRRLHYKVLERRAKCLLALKMNDEALMAFRATISSIDDSDLPLEKRQKMQMDAQLMIEIINKGQQMLAANKNLAKMAESKKPNVLASPPTPKVTGKISKSYPSLSEGILITQDDVQGRFAIAEKDISIGDTVLVEKAHCNVLLKEYSMLYCQHCLTRCSLPIACPKCPNVVFCSDTCLEEAIGSYHGLECPILPIVWASGCSITCHMALRIMTQRNVEYFRRSLNNSSERKVYKGEDYYGTLHSLVTHETKRNKNDLLHRAHMAAFLLKILQQCGYFDINDKTVNGCAAPSLKNIDETEIRKDKNLIGGLILRNLQIAQFNAHEVFDLQCEKPKVNECVLKHSGKTVFIGGGIYPTLALFNHSCDPDVVRYFSGRHIVVRAVKSIKKGNPVSENYGPIFTTVKRPQRLAAMKDQYWFDCGCLACRQDWPLYSQMNENYLRFKCDSARPCANVVAVPHDAAQFMVQCGLCGQHTNILKGLKGLQDTDMMFRLGKHAMDSGKYAEALLKFSEVLKLYEEFLAPPFRGYYDCVQNIRRCLLSMGNYSFKQNQ